MAAMANLCGSSHAVLEGSLQLRPSNGRISVARSGFIVRAQQVSAEPEIRRRAVLVLVGAGMACGSLVQAVVADNIGIKEFIDKKAWRYVKNDLRLRAEYHSKISSENSSLQFGLRSKE